MRRLSLDPVGEGDQRLHIFHGQRGQPIGHEPDDIRAKLTPLVLQAEGDGVVARRAVAAAVPVGAKDRNQVWERLLDDVARVRQLVLGGLSILVAHG